MANRLFLVRGLPGSGKSDVAASLGPSVSADDYFMQEGRYAFDPRQLRQAHAWCLARAGQMCDDLTEVVVANTFSQRWEMEPYLRLAGEGNIRVHVVDLFDGGLTDDQLHARNVHGVPLRTSMQMRARWEHDWKAGSPCAPVGGKGD